MKLSIELVTAAPKLRAHFLGRLTDRVAGVSRIQGVQVDDDLGITILINKVCDPRDRLWRAVAARTAQGLFYGVQTLRSCCNRMAEGNACGAGFGDPRLAQHGMAGVQDDISRGPILSLDYLKIQIRTLAEYKINLLGFNMENVFDFETQSLVSPKDAAPKEARR